MSRPSSASQRKRNTKSVDEIYSKKTQLEHILLRPDTYIGSVESESRALWVVDERQKRMALKNISYVPGLYKIFDEILVNAADNKQRDPSMSLIRVQVDRLAGMISVMNDGQGIPVQLHKKENMYVPELIFGHLLTSSNYNDKEKKTVGGRNGYGAKLANIFSRKFTVETCDSERGLLYKQTWRDNMSRHSKAEITPTAMRSYTKVAFQPDFPKFGMREFDSDTYSLFVKRVYDIAGTTPGVKVELNGHRIKVNNFQQYVDMYPIVDGKKVYEKISDRWEVALACTDEGQFQQVSHVNSIWTINGGTHCKYLMDKICKKFIAKLKGKAKNLKPAHVKSQCFLFVNTLIENPAFSSQTKETLTLKKDKFGSSAEFTDDFFKKALKLSIKDHILSYAKYQADRGLKKNDGKKLKCVTHPKYTGASWAGSKNWNKSSQCVLILTEGDSAKALAIAGRPQLGIETHGVFPLKGKMLNVRDANSGQVTKNVEISALKQIIGLKNGVDYSNEANFRKLRYGAIMVMTDQDHDGSHIKGLVINFVHRFWPALVKRQGFMKVFVTPIVVATKNKGKANAQRLEFFTLPEFEKWKKRGPGGLRKGWDCKYYKGLGTSTDREMQSYCSQENRKKHLKEFRYSGEDCDDKIELAFSKKRVEDRKTWLQSFEPGTYLDHNMNKVSYKEFVDKELILFSRADNCRSIPSMVDGLKPGQRKVLFACFQRNLKKDVKVAQLQGSVSERSAYHHGDASLVQTIVGMAQNFCGSNNINLLYPSGQFGTRMQGGKDAASARYISTHLCKITRKIFHVDDDPLLNYLNDDGLWVEPEWYIPIIPMVLVNGSEGIGTGYSTSIPNHNPRDIVENLKRMLDGKEPLPMEPDYKNWTGDLRWNPSKKAAGYLTLGRARQIGPQAVEITELPVKEWTEKYKLNVLQKLHEAELVKDINDKGDNQSVCFEVLFAPEFNFSGVDAKFFKRMKLVGTLSVSNLMLFNQHGKLQKYVDTAEILQEFYIIRMKFYDKRKAHLIKVMEEARDKLSAKERFIKMIVDEELIINKRKKAQIIADLQRHRFPMFFPEKKKTNKVEEEEVETEDRSPSVGYKYLLNMPIFRLTYEEIEKLQKEREEKELKLDNLYKTTTKDMYRHDLDELLKALEEHEAEEKSSMHVPKTRKKKRVKKMKGRGKAKNDDPKFEVFSPNTKKKKEIDYGELITELLGSAAGNSRRGGKSTRGSTASASSTPSGLNSGDNSMAEPAHSNHKKKAPKNEKPKRVLEIKKESKSKRVAKQPVITSPPVQSSSDSDGGADDWAARLRRRLANLNKSDISNESSSQSPPKTTDFGKFNAGLSKSSVPAKSKSTKITNFFRSSSREPLKSRTLNTAAILSDDSSDDNEPLSSKIQKKSLNKRIVRPMVGSSDEEELVTRKRRKLITGASLWDAPSDSD